MTPSAPEKETTRNEDQSTRRFFEAEYDELAYDGEHQKYYLICFGPRAGSWLLCDLLRSSGVLGVPAEYFDPRAGANFFAERFGLLVDGKIDIHAYTTVVKRHRTTSNGVFGAKVQYWQMPALIKDRVISKHFPGAKFIYLTRNNVVAQGVSLAVAQRTKQYANFRGSAPDAQPRADLSFDRQHVMKAIDFVLVEHLRWTKFFALNDIEPLQITYESLIEDSHRTCQKIAGYLGINTDYFFSLEGTNLLKQSNELNEDWIKKIKAMAVY